MRTLPLALAAFAAAGTALPSLAAANPYDGRWSVEVVSERAECAGRYVVPIEVRGGQVHYVGRSDVDAEGVIGADGRVNVTLSSGGDVMNARGTLNRPNFGYGSWRSPTEDCDGTWVARK